MSWARFETILLMLPLISLMLSVRTVWAVGAICFSSSINLVTFPKALITSSAVPSLVPLVASARKSPRLLSKEKQMKKKKNK